MSTKEREAIVAVFPTHWTVAPGQEVILFPRHFSDAVRISEVHRACRPVPNVDLSDRDLLPRDSVCLVHEILEFGRANNVSVRGSLRHFGENRCRVAS